MKLRVGRGGPGSALHGVRVRVRAPAGQRAVGTRRVGGEKGGLIAPPHPPRPAHCFSSARPRSLSLSVGGAGAQRAEGR